MTIAFTVLATVLVVGALNIAFAVWLSRRISSKFTQHEINYFFNRIG